MVLTCWRSWRTGLGAAILMLGVVTGAHATLIDVQFTQTGSPSYSGAAELGSAGNGWNTVTGPFTNSGSSAKGISLNDVTGASSGITLSYKTSEGFINAASYKPFFAGTPYANLLDSYMYGAGTVTLSGLTAGSDYELVLYSVANSAGRVTDFTVDGFEQSVDPTSTKTLTDGVNYTDFMIDDALSTLTIGFNGIHGSEGDLNGLQLLDLQNTPVPEPSSLLLLGTGLLLTFAARRALRSRVLGL